MPIYEIANPSDPVTIEAESDADAALAVLVLEPGGSYGCRSADSEGRMVLPVLRFWSEPAAEEWLSENPAVTADQQTPERRRRIAAVLESAAVCSISDVPVWVRAVFTGLPPASRRLTRRYLETRLRSSSATLAPMEKRRGKRRAATRRKHAEEPESKRVVVSLFTGAGGLDIGLEKAGLPSTVCVEVDAYSCDSLRFNRPGLAVLQQDVRALTGKKILKELGSPREVFLVAGGPPCQSFSPGGNRAGLSDPRGNLILEYFRLVRELRPRFFLFENVANLVTAALEHRPIDQRPGKMWNLNAYHGNRTLNSDDAPPMRDEELSGSAIKYLLEEIKTLRYKLVFGVVDAAEYGAPQHRHRFLMIGSRDGNPPPLPRPTHGDEATGTVPFRTLRDAIYDLREDPGHHYRYTEEFQQIFRLVPPGGNWRSLPKDLHERALGNSFEAGGGKTGYFRRLSWEEPSPTVTAKSNRKGSSMCHPEVIRPISLRESARLQCFPDDWVFVGPTQEQYRQIGNAVPTVLGEAAGRALLSGVEAADDELHVMTMLVRAQQKLRKTARNKRGSAVPGTLFS